MEVLLVLILTLGLIAYAIHWSGVEDVEANDVLEAGDDCFDPDETIGKPKYRDIVSRNH